MRLSVEADLGPCLLEACLLEYLGHLLIVRVDHGMVGDLYERVEILCCLTHLDGIDAATGGVSSRDEPLRERRWSRVVTAASDESDGCPEHGDPDRAARERWNRAHLPSRLAGDRTR